jgi:BlaI family transcriptional regulator, penicillinase repressor
MAASPRWRSARDWVRRIVDRVCNGSVEEVLVGMIDTNMIDRMQLHMLEIGGIILP